MKQIIQSYFWEQVIKILKSFQLSLETLFLHKKYLKIRIVFKLKWKSLKKIITLWSYDSMVQ